MALKDDQRSMDEATLLDFALRLGHTLRDDHPKDKSFKQWQCVGCSEKVQYRQGQMQPSLIEEKCLGTSPRVLVAETSIEEPAPDTLAADVIEVIEKPTRKKAVMPVAPPSDIPV